jgi:hypothetical protein
MATTTKQLDQNQEALRTKFENLVREQPVAIAKKYLQLFGPTLFHRLACELSINYSQSDKARGYYFPALRDPAELILLKVLQKLLSTQPTKQPILLIAGGGPGSGKLTTSINPLLALRREILCSYDVSNYSLETIESLIKNLHQLKIPTIVAYIDRPLPLAARDAIIRTLSEDLQLDPAAFARAHQQNYSTFLQLNKRYQKQRLLFASVVILNSGPPDHVYSTKASFLKNHEITIANAERTFTEQLHQLLAAGTEAAPSTFPTTRSRKPAPIPRTGKTMIGRSAKIGYLLAQNLRANLIKLEKTPDKNQIQLLSPKSSPPTKNLIHDRLSLTKETLIKISNTKGQTLKGQKHSLDNQRPLRTAVQETSNRMHEMITVRIR